jgi:site-specific recombinase XerD
MDKALTSKSKALIVIGGRPLDQNPAAVYLAGLNTESGRRTMRQALNAIAGMLSGDQANALTLDWSAVRFQHVTAIRTRLQEQGLRAATINKYLCALRGTLKAAWLLGYIAAEDYHKAAAMKGVRIKTLPAGRELSGDEIRALMTTCEEDSSPAGARDAALIALLYGTGLRRAEVVNLDLADYEPATGRLVVRGKGGKERTVWVTGGVATALADWLKVRGDPPGPLFWPIAKGGKLKNRRMTSQAVYKMLHKRADEASVEEFSPHDLRRTFVSDLLEAGADIAVVSRMAGHANVATTARYDRRGEEAERKAADLLSVPHKRRRR